jgi:hypothetical protein
MLLIQQGSEHQLSGTCHICKEIGDNIPPARISINDS